MDIDAVARRERERLGIRRWRRRGLRGRAAQPGEEDSADDEPATRRGSAAFADATRT
jgi:hypothetical protein